MHLEDELLRIRYQYCERTSKSGQFSSTGPDYKNWGISYLSSEVFPCSLLSVLFLKASGLEFFSFPFFGLPLWGENSRTFGISLKWHQLSLCNVRARHCSWLSCLSLIRGQVNENEENQELGLLCVPEPAQCTERVHTSLTHGSVPGTTWRSCPACPHSAWQG